MLLWIHNALVGDYRQQWVLIWSLCIIVDNNGYCSEVNIQLLVTIIQQWCCFEVIMPLLLTICSNTGAALKPKSSCYDSDNTQQWMLLWSHNALVGNYTQQWKLLWSQNALVSDYTQQWMLLWSHNALVGNYSQQWKLLWSQNALVSDYTQQWLLLWSHNALVSDQNITMVTALKS